MAVNAATFCNDHMDNICGRRFVFFGDTRPAHSDWQVTIAALILLGIHIGNLILYFKLAGDEPYKWKRESEAKGVGA